MRILIASDLHGSVERLRFLVNRASEIQPNLIVLLGDLVYHGPRNPLPQGYDTSSVLSDITSLLKLDAPVIAVRGNCDAEVDMALLPFQMTESAWIEADGFPIYVSHGHRLPENPPLQGFNRGSAILRGHTHVPRAEVLEGIHFWNPGSLSLPKGGFPPSYGIYENGVFRVLTLGDQELMRDTIA